MRLRIHFLNTCHCRRGCACASISPKILSCLFWTELCIYWLVIDCALKPCVSWAHASISQPLCAPLASSRTPHASIYLIHLPIGLYRFQSSDAHVNSSSNPLFFRIRTSTCLNQFPTTWRPFAATRFLSILFVSSEHAHMQIPQPHTSLTLGLSCQQSISHAFSGSILYAHAHLISSTKHIH